jgi:hypothetical protein
LQIIADAISEELDSQPDERPPGLFPLIKHCANRIFPNNITLMIPISIRPVGNTDMINWSSGTLANLRIGTDAKHGLPMGPRAMHARLHDNANTLRVLKNSILPKISFWLIQLTGQAPLLFPSLMWTPIQPIVQWVLEYSLESLCAVVTNVPGPKGRIEMAGSEVVSRAIPFRRRLLLIYPSLYLQKVRWGASPPQGGKSTLGIGIISYADDVCITIAADHVKGRYSDGVARRITARFEERWAEYIEVADKILSKGERKSK